MRKYFPLENRRGKFKYDLKKSFIIRELMKSFRLTI